ncbi:hypothetical protein FRX31_012291 [Thalictrum thalictroides]|uniref:Transmembrane protein n=1 Tax=Thalictrum thalictroides TaxID=46969 RepID=A0A7J6WNU1_THATH|nr:hypothetical protein FRX31_012291 [Thalictrum thalictroides]
MLVFHVLRCIDDNSRRGGVKQRRGQDAGMKLSIKQLICLMLNVSIFRICSRILLIIMLACHCAIVVLWYGDGFM